jgi:murein DD-endopeptidase MepM/ murein hydrolase activator NlpD
MKVSRLSACFAAFLVASLFCTACEASPVNEVAQPLPSASSAYPIASPLPSRTPVPPPTRRAPPATEIPSATPIPSLTPLPPPFKYVFPIQPPKAAAYGEGVQGHGYPATDLFAQVGTKFVAVTDGVVEFVSGTDAWNPNHPDPARRSGLAVALIGDDGLRYYGSHLSGIAPGIYTGVRVKAGQLLGYVGASGDARGKTPHLHFGISHPTTPGDWKTRRGEVNPFPYLNAWKKGINRTPKLP